MTAGELPGRVDEVLAARSSTWTRGVMRFVRRQPVGAASGVILIAVVLIAIFAPVVARYEPTAVFRGEALLGPSGDHWFGTDDIGRDVYARIVFGARISVTVGVVPVVVAVVLGWSLGLTSGFWGGWYDLAVQRVIDAWIAFPTLILAITLAAVVRPGIHNVLIAISVILVPGFVRIVRSVTLPLTQASYVEAARSLGASDTRILVRHIMPNTVAVVLILMSVSHCWSDPHRVVPQLSRYWDSASDHQLGPDAQRQRPSSRERRTVDWHRTRRCDRGCRARSEPVW